jgi:hypothetical protein
VVAEAADLLKLSAANLQRIVSERMPLPLARTASREEAELVFNRLRDLGLRTIILSDSELGQSETSVKRMKSMSFDEQRVVIQQAGTKEAAEIRWQDLVLIVTGRLFVRRVEIKERKTRRAENEIIDTSEFSSDEAVIDLYAATHFETWRVNANGFDFSCLETKKSLIANENIATLLQVMVANARQAEVDDSYRRLRNVLELVWGPEQETQSSGWRRERPGKLSIGLATVNSNESQFTRYSRLRRHFNSNPSLLVQANG